MKVEKLKFKDGLQTLRITASAKEVAEAFDKGLDSFLDQVGQASNVDLHALPGDSARAKIEGAMDAETAKQTIETAVMSWLIPYALQKENIIPVASADAKAETILSEKLPFTFVMTVAPKPRYELTDYEPFSVDVPGKPEVTESDIDSQVHMLQLEYARAKAAANGEDPADVEVPALTDQWVAENLTNLEVSTVAELRESFRRNAGAALDDQYQQQKMAAIMGVYAKRFKGEIPPQLMDLVAKDMMQGLTSQVLSQGMELEYYLAQQDTTEEEVLNTFREQAYYQLMQGFILDAIFRHEGLQLEIQDLMSLIHGMAPGNEEDAFNQLQETGRAFLLKEGAERAKALTWIDEHIVVNHI